MVMVGGEDGGGEVNMEMGRCEGALSDGGAEGAQGGRGCKGCRYGWVLAREKLGSVGVDRW